MPTANLIFDNQSLAIDVVKPNYTIRAFLSGILLFGGIIDSECKQVWFFYRHRVFYSEFAEVEMSFGIRSSPGIAILGDAFPPFDAFHSNNSPLHIHSLR